MDQQLFVAIILRPINTGQNMYSRLLDYLIPVRQSQNLLFFAIALAEKLIAGVSRPLLCVAWHHKSKSTLFELS